MRLLLILVSIFLSFNLCAQNIATINIFEIINNNDQYNEFLITFNKKKLEYDELISLKQTDLEKNKLKLENDKDIYSNEILNYKINEFNNNLMMYQKEIAKIDNYITQTITYNEKLIMQSIAKLTSNYARDKDIKLILDENHYFIASTDIDISDYISQKLKNIIFEFELLKESDFFEN